MDTLAGVWIEREPVKTVPSVHQYLDILNVDDAVVTKAKPSNAELLEEIRTRQPAVERVFRYMNFPDGFPAIYQWVKREIPGKTTYRIQEMTTGVWMAAMEREEATGTGHIGPVIVEDENERSEQR